MICQKKASDTLAILGAGGFGREVLWAAKEARIDYPASPYPFADFVFIDDNPDLYNKAVCGAFVIGSLDDVLQDDYYCSVFICGVGSPKIKKAFVEKLMTGKHQNFGTVIHKSVNMSDHILIGKGTVICAGTNITTQVTIGKHVSINLDCTIGHDCVIEDYVNISPGVHISGYCTLEKGCDIGTGVNIIPHITIGEGAVVAAGATITKDVPPYTMVAGVPAVVKKELKG